MIVLNSLRDKGAGFGKDTNVITIYGSDGNEAHFDLRTKKECASDIVDAIEKRLCR